MDQAKFLNLFLCEADEQLGRLEEGILALETSPTPQVIQELFRTAHTLKGSAGSMGFAGISGLTHCMENVLDRLRDGRLEVSPPLVNLLLDSLDRLKVLREEVGDTGHEQAAVADLCGRLDEASRAPSDGPMYLEVHVRLTADCLMKGARVLTLLRRLEAAGTVVGMTPPLEKVEQEEFDREVVCEIVTSQDPAALRAWLSEISDVEHADVVPSGTDRLPGPARKPDERVADLGPKARGRPPENLAVMRRQASHSIRVDVERLDELMNLVGELVIDRIRLTQVTQEMQTRDDIGGLSDALQETAHHLARITTELQAQIMKARMLPIEQLFSRFPRFVRDLAQKAGKQVDLIVEGQETELDRSVIEQIGDPLIHLLRNALDHGIEAPEERQRLGKPPAGRVRLAAAQEENSIAIVVEDDGAGIDPGRIRAKAVSLGIISEEQAQRLSPEEVLNLIFVPGLTTAASVNDVSGRGVGMDIVRSNLQRIGGTVDVESTPGLGTRFVLRFPLTLAIVRALLVQCADETYALPLSAIHETIEIAPEQVRHINGRGATLLRGSVLPLIPLVDVLGRNGNGNDDGRGSRLCVVTGLGSSRVGLLVDRVIGEQEVVIKPLGTFVGNVSGISGATILGDGRVSLILDMAAVMRMAAGRREWEHAG